MNRWTNLAVAAVALAAPLPAAAVTIDLSRSGSWTGQPGYFEQTQNFFLPTNAVNVALTITNFVVDDRGVLSLNGTGVDMTGIFASNGTLGLFNYSQNTPALVRVFNAPGVRNRTVTTGFVLGGNNAFLFQGNDTNNGIYGEVLATAALASYTYAASVSYDLATTGVPEPATWAMMMLGFGAVGASLRVRHRTAVRFA